MARISDTRFRPRAVRQVTPLQFLGGLLSFLFIAVLIGVLVAGSLVPAVGAVGATVKAAPETFEEIPDTVAIVTPSEESRMVDADGKLIARFYSTRRIVVKSDQISQHLKDAIIAIEDRRFYSHHGIDPDGLARALVYNLATDSTQGASTITQQYIKNMLVEEGIQAGDEDLIDAAQAHSLQRKLREARYALALEHKMTKDEILTGYLNLAPFGANIYGVEAASRAYFSTSAKDLTISQAALVAGITNSPNEYDPLQNPNDSQKRRDLVLEKMVEQGYITNDEYEEAKAENVEDMLDPEDRKEGCAGASTNMGYFCRYVVEDFLADSAYGETRQERQNLLDTGGLVIRTTLNRDLQKKAFTAVKDRVPIDDNGGGADTVDTAIVSVEPETGYIIAMAQNTRYGPTTEDDLRSTEVSYNVYTDHGGGSGFQPGSTFKAFTLTEWFKEGRFAYDTVGSTNRNYPNGSFTCDGSAYGTGDWRVEDLPGKDGAQTVLNVMKLSINQGIVSMATKVDYCQIFQRATDLGIVKVDGEPIGPENPTGLIGGSDSVAPLLMASAYSTFANGGVRCEPMALTEVADRDGSTIKSYAPTCNQVLDSQVAGQVATVLKMVAGSYDYQISHDSAAKSGTTDDNSNTWMVGFTPQIATAAWAGFANESSRGVQDMIINGEYWEAVLGGTFIGPMWTQYMEDATEDMDDETIPSMYIGTQYVPKKASTTTNSTNRTSTTTSTTTGSSND